MNVPLDGLVRRLVNEAKEKTVEKISGADLLGMRAHAKEAENYVLACGAYVDRLTRVYVAIQVENVRLRAALQELVRLDDQYRPGPAPHQLMAAWDAARAALTPNV